jgi:hypothetical protein
MRHETCLTCRLGDVTRLQLLGTWLAEALGADAHHHHLVTCADCGASWFDDAVIGALGVLVPARRDTVFCGCPVDGREIYTPSVILVCVPEARCRCSLAALARARAA